MFTAVQFPSWVYPSLEVVHLIGVALLLGNLVLLELRVFGLAPELPVRPLARLSLSLVGTGFALAIVSGALMFASQPQELIANRVFVVKMLLLFAAGSNAAMFHARQSLEKLDTAARWHLLVSTALWLAILACGRWIAYI